MALPFNVSAVRRHKGAAVPEAQPVQKPKEPGWACSSLPFCPVQSLGQRLILGSLIGVVLAFAVRRFCRKGQ